MPLKHSHQGNALITALFIMALITITATAIIQQLRLDIARAHRFTRTDKLYLAAQMIPFWTMTQLSNPQLILEESASTAPVLVFPETLSKTYPEVSLSGKVYDLQGRFNINNVSDDVYQDPFLDLLKEVDPNINPNLAKMLLAATKNWILPETGVNEDQWSNYYQSLQPPYQTAHQRMQTVSELQFVAGMTQPLYQNLSPLLTALPETTLININTAPEKLLRALNPKLNEAEWHDFLLDRHDNPLSNQDAFNKIMSLYPFTTNVMTFRSQYFLSIANAKQGPYELTLYSVLKRFPTQESVWQVKLIKQSINLPPT